MFSSAFAVLNGRIDHLRREIAAIEKDLSGYDLCEDRQKDLVALYAQIVKLSDVSDELMAEQKQRLAIHQKSVLEHIRYRNEKKNGIADLEAELLDLHRAIETLVLSQELAQIDKPDIQPGDALHV